MSTKVRVYEIARDLGMDNKALVALFQSVGVSEVRNHMSAVGPEAVERVKRHLEKQKAQKVVEERIRPTVIKRKAATREGGGTEPVGAAAHTPAGHGHGHGAVVGRSSGAGGSAHSSGGYSDTHRGHHDTPRAESSTARAQVGTGTRSAGARVAGGAVSAPATSAGAPAVVGSQASHTSVSRPSAAEPSHGAESPSTTTGSSVREAAGPSTVTASNVSSTAGGVAAELGTDSAAGGSHGMTVASPAPAPVVSSGTATQTAGSSRGEALPGAASSAASTTGATSVDASKGSDGPRESQATTSKATVPMSEHRESARTDTEPHKVTPEVPPRVISPDSSKSEARDGVSVADVPPRNEVREQPGAAVETATEPRVPVAEKVEAAAPAPKEKPMVEAVAQSAPEPVVSPAAPKAAPQPVSPAPVPAPVAATQSRQDPKPTPSQPPRAPTPSQAPPRPAPKTGIEVWEGRAGVPMPQPPRGAPQPRRQTFDAKAPGNMAGRGRPGQMQGNRGGQRGGIRRGGPQGGPISRGARPVGPPPTQERAAHKKVIKIEETIGLQGLGIKIGVKAQDLLRTLMTLGMQNLNINTTLDADTAKLVANEFGWEVEDVAVSMEDAITTAQGIVREEKVEDTVREPRPPVVTVMGHVDHGKTSLLDVIRKSNVVAGEAGGITQHIGAYSVETPHGRLTFLDTPGHAAFTAMRARGAKVTDIIVLVVAADDGLMPQTVEAIAHAKSAKVPIVVAINKIDKPEAQADRVRRQLAEQGLVPEEWGGDTLMCEVSAVKKTGIDNLLEQLVLQAEVLELRANPNKPAVGVVIEAELDRGKGPVATVLVTDGTLRRGDCVLAGAGYGKVRAMLDDRGRQLNSAGPSTPVSIVGLNDVPAAGDPVHVMKDMKGAEKIAERRKTTERRSISTSGPRMSIEEMLKGMGKGEELEVKLIIKADVQGSVEAVAEAVRRLSGDKVKVTVVHAGVGAITEGDVNTAIAAGGLIVGFNVRPAGKASSLAQKEKVEIRQHNIIYDVVDDVRGIMEGRLAPKLVEKQIGKAEVRSVFKLSKAGVIAGSMILEGTVRRNANARVFRDGEQIWEGKIGSLKRFKEDVREVKEGFECGIGLDGFQELKESDIVEVFDLEQVKQTL